MPQDHCKKPVWCLEPFALGICPETCRRCPIFTKCSLLFFVFWKNVPYKELIVLVKMWPFKTEFEKVPGIRSVNVSNQSRSVKAKHASCISLLCITNIKDHTHCRSSKLPHRMHVPKYQDLPYCSVSMCLCMKKNPFTAKKYNIKWPQCLVGLRGKLLKCIVKITIQCKYIFYSDFWLQVPFLGTEL